MDLEALLKAAGGQFPISSPLGKWGLAVSKRVNQILTSGAAAPAYGQVKAVTAQNGIGTDTLLLSNPGVFRGDLSYIPGTGTWVLKEGRTYLLRAAGWFQNFSNTTAGLLRVSWVDDDNNRLVSGTIDCPDTQHAPQSSTGAISSSAALEFIYTAGTTQASQLAKLQVVSATGTADMVANSWWASVTELPG